MFQVLKVIRMISKVFEVSRILFHVLKVIRITFQVFEVSRILFQVLKVIRILFQVFEVIRILFQILNVIRILFQVLKVTRIMFQVFEVSRILFQVLQVIRIMFQVFEVSRIMVHPEWDEHMLFTRGQVGTPSDHDLALVKLVGRAEVSPWVRPVCLPEPQAVPETGEPCVVTGWGFSAGEIVTFDFSFLLLLCFFKFSLV